MMNGTVTWKNVSYEDLDPLEFSYETNKTAMLFLVNLVLMIILLFFIFGILAITAIVSYASDEVEELHELKNFDSSLFKHNLF